MKFRQTSLQGPRVPCGALAMLCACLALTVASQARAGEIIPSVGITRPVHTGGTDAKIYGGVAFRGDLSPLIKSEVGIAYRPETRLDGNLKVQQWPLTASLWLAPTPNLYAGGGVGWYQTTYNYSDAYAAEFGAKDETKSEFGEHLGGGIGVPLTPALGIDINGRYVFMNKSAGDLPNGHFNPNFWSTTAGLAFHY